MPRDRKRAKQRRGSRSRAASADGRQTRAGAARTASPTAPGAAGSSEPPTPAVPGPIDHASGEVEEFDAALAIGASGVFAESAEEEPEDDEVPGAGNGGVDVATLGEPDDTEEEESDGAGGDGNGGVPGVGTLTEERPEPARRRRAAAPEPHEHRSLWARAIAFLRASWAELQRMQWPDRRQTSQATAVVLGFVVVAGLYLGAADWVAQKIVNLII